MSLSTVPQRSRHAGLSLDEALSKLREACRTIESREGVKNHERTRIQEALRLVTTTSAPSDSKTAERQESYQHFLRRVEKLCGLEIVALCAVGLGKTAIAGMREKARLELPSDIKHVENTLKCPPLRQIIGEQLTKGHVPSTSVESTETISEANTPPEAETQALEPNPEAAQPIQQIGSFAGRVFQLTLQDAQSIVMSNQVSGGVWLTDPYFGTSLPFITIPITEQLSRHYTTQRPQAM